MLSSPTTVPWFVLACALAAFRPAAAEEVSARLPSLVLVTIDTLRADRLGSYGYGRDTSPNLDAFAEQAILFERAYTTMSTTLPAHASMMTGTYPMTHRVQANAFFLPHSLDDATSLRMLAEMLHDHGYATSAFVSAAPLKRHSGIDRGFDVYRQPSFWQRNALRTTKLVLRSLEQPPLEPFFLWVHYFDPHWPYSPPEEHAVLFEEDEALRGYLERIGVETRRWRKILRINNAYDGEVHFVDAQIGRLFERLKTLGVWDDAVVVVTSDHGEGLGQHDYEHHGTIFNEQLHVPLLIKLPGSTSGRRIDRVTSIVDLLPILAASTDLPLDAARQFQGVDTLGSAPGRVGVLSERVHRKGPWGRGRRYSVTAPNWKLLHSPEGSSSLFDLRSDPHEMQDVIDDHPEVAKALLEELSEQRRRFGRGPDEIAAPDLDDELLEELRALGYVD